MLKEALKEILQLNRPEKQTITEYGNYTSREITVIYSDAEKRYCVPTKKGNNCKVSNAKSFACFINEECKRRENVTGEKATAIINESGGYFIADSDFNEGNCEFKRSKSQQWIILENLVNRTLGHEQFLLALQQLNPSIQDYEKMYRKFLKIRIIGRSELNSNPIFVDGEAESGYCVKYKLEDGMGDEEIFPDHIVCKLPYTKGSDLEYELVVKISFLNNGDNKIAIRIDCPLFEKTEEKAIFDETEQLRADLKGLSDLLILENY